MNIVQEQERRVAGKAPKPAKFRRTRVQSDSALGLRAFCRLAVLVLLRTFQRGVGTLKPAQPPVRPVTVAKVVTKDVPLYLDEIGTCAAYETVQVQAQVSGANHDARFSGWCRCEKRRSAFHDRSAPVSSGSRSGKSASRVRPGER